MEVGKNINGIALKLIYRTEQIYKFYLSGR